MKATTLPASRSNDLYEVTLVRTGVVYATAKRPWMTMQIARPLCTAISDLSHHTGASGLVMDLTALAKATPTAGFYALGQMKKFPIERIALLRGTPFVRIFARTVLTIARFPAFQFFDNEARAMDWAAGFIPDPRAVQSAEKDLRATASAEQQHHPRSLV